MRGHTWLICITTAGAPKATIWLVEYYTMVRTRLWQPCVLGFEHARRTDTDMGIDAGVSGCPCEVLVFTVGNMLMSPRIAVPLRKPEVDNVNDIRSFRKAYEKVIRLDVSVDKVFVVDILDPSDQLVCN